MKTFFSLLFTLAMATTALAQGKVRFANDSLHLVFWNPNCDALGYPGSKTFAGHVYWLGDGELTLIIELWAGTSSNSLTLLATTDFQGQVNPGTWVGANLAMPSISAGTNYFQITIYDASLPPPIGTPLGWTPIFTAVASGGTPYNNLYQHTSPVWSTWPDGGYPLDTDVGPGARGSIMLSSFLEWQVPPPLSIQPAGPGQMTIDWVTPGFSYFYLQMNDSLAPGGWVDAPSGTAHPVTVTLTGSARHYRLIKRCP